MAAKAVWKFPIPVDDVAKILMPKGAKILHVAEQFGIPCIWALVDTDPSVTKVIREFRFSGTGHTIYDHQIGEHIGTFVMQGGQLVFHIFETKASVEAT